MALDLPDSIARYLHAENSGEDVVAEVFAPDAEVRDEREVHRGHAAIRAWKASARARYRYGVESLSAQRQGDRVALRVRVAGNFPGSPVELDYAIALADGLIATLEIR